MEPNVTGAWRLVTWRRIESDGSVVHPFGREPLGILVYTPDGCMAVQMLASDRPALDTADPLGGSESARAQAYSSSLAYFGRYEVQGESVIHYVEASSFPNWSNTVQDRPFVCKSDELSLRVLGTDGRITNEIIWQREGIRGEASRRSPGQHGPGQRGPGQRDRDGEGGTLVKEGMKDFLGLSACLTGFDRLRLLATGMSGEYLRTLESILPPGMLARLLSTYRELPEGSARDQLLTERILDSSELGPVARNLIVLWYSGTWKELPEDWREAHGRSPADETHVVSPAAYLSGLQWTVVGAHPAGGQQQGFGSWSEPPWGRER